MAVFAVSFRIHENADYERRYDSVVAAIKEADTSGCRWSETTSFFLVQFRNSSEGLVNAIVGNSHFDGTIDLLLVVNLTNRAYAVRGKNPDADLAEIMALR